MKAATARSYGPPEGMRIESLPDPFPGQGEVLVAVQAFGVTRGDTRIRGLDVPRGMGLILRLVFGVTRLRRIVPGREFAGVIAGLGAGVTGWRVGQKVIGLTPGMTLGAGAEALVMKPGETLFARPEGMSAAEGAAVFFGGLTAADFLIDQAALKPGERVLINGASGAVGVAMVQLARHLGAQVTAVCSAQNHDFVRDLGADAVHDYRDGPPAGRFDVIADVAGTLPWGAASGLLTPGGRRCLITADLCGMLGASLRPKRGTHRLCASVVKETGAAMARVLELTAKGVLRAPITTLPFDAIVEAHRLASGGHKRGNVVVVFD